MFSRQGGGLQCVAGTISHLLAWKECMEAQVTVSCIQTPLGSYNMQMHASHEVADDVVNLIVPRIVNNRPNRPDKAWPAVT